MLTLLLLVRLDCVLLLFALIEVVSFGFPPGSTSRLMADTLPALTGPI